MRGFVKRVSRKIAKLSPDQVEVFLNALNDENDTLDSIFESLSDGLIIVDDFWRLLSNNKAAERYIPFKIRPDDNRAESLFLWDLIDDGTAYDVADFFRDCKEKDINNVCSEFTVPAPGGSVRFITITLVPFVRQHTASGTVITVADVTEKRNQEVLLHRMENLASLTNLAANVAHEIKNPLGAIGIHIQLIQKALRRSRDTDGMLPDKKYLENYLDVVNEEIDNLNKIVVDFLFAVRPVQANMALVNPVVLLKHFAEFFEPQFVQNNMKLDLQLAENAPRLLIDEKLFREVTANIVQNALAAIAERLENQMDTVRPREPGRLCISAAKKNDKFIITFSDNGMGMSEETAAHVFEPYYTTKANGTGLGMTLVYKIIKEFRGDITVHSERGKGTVFTITLPIPQTDRKLLPAAAEPAADKPKGSDAL